VNTVAAGEVLNLEGNLSYETIPGVLAETAQFAARADLPETIRIDFAGVTGVDSAAVAHRETAHPNHARRRPRPPSVTTQLTVTSMT
jgi:ABC-type transporter Mla MlaB component